VTWSARVGMAVAVLAALAIGQTIDKALPVQHVDDRPFVHRAEVGQRVSLDYADVTVRGVHATPKLDTPQGDVGTPGRWLIVDMTLVARGRPLSAPGFALEDGRGRTFDVDPRSGYSWEAAPTGVPWRVHVPFEVPADALPDAQLVITRNTHDSRRDDAAHIDLGISADDAAALWKSIQPVEIPPAGMATS
jgi:hypothetical protein